MSVASIEATLNSINATTAVDKAARKKSHLARKAVHQSKALKLLQKSMDTRDSDTADTLRHLALNHARSAHIHHNLAHHHKAVTGRD